MHKSIHNTSFIRNLRRGIISMETFYNNKDLKVNSSGYCEKLNAIMIHLQWPSHQGIDAKGNGARPRCLGNENVLEIKAHRLPASD